jgi:hypothetical protein
VDVDGAQQLTKGDLVRMVLDNEKLVGKFFLSFYLSGLS